MNVEYPKLEETIQKYVLGTLTEHEKGVFEEYFIANPEIIEQINIAQKIHSLSAMEQEQRPRDMPENKRSLLELIRHWLSIPVPAFAAVAAVALLTPMLANQFSVNKNQDIELVAFSSSVTRGADLGGSRDFDIVADLSDIHGQAAIIIKVTPDVMHSYHLEVYDSKDKEGSPLWRSPPFIVKSGTRDQLIKLPDSVKVQNAILRVLGEQPDGSFFPVRFCHYSETCL